MLLRKQEARLSQLRLERKNINVKLKLVEKTTLIQPTEVHILKIKEISELVIFIFT